MMRSRLFVRDAAWESQMSATRVCYTAKWAGVRGWRYFVVYQETDARKWVLMPRWYPRPGTLGSLRPRKDFPMLIRTLSPLFFSGLACAAPSFPVLKYSTYLRDSFVPKAIATDSSGNVYMAGNAVVDPATSQSTVLVVKLNPQGSQYLYVRYFGGSVKDSANAIAVDGEGNAYVAGSTASPDFPVTSGGRLGTAPMGLTSQRSFVVKLDPSGAMVFSDLLGGSAGSAAQAIAVNATGQIIVTGMVSDGGGPAFPTTAGAYSIANTANHPYLLELDPTGTKTVFSATGIGGGAIALDASGNIYVAGSTSLLDYPTTPGAYQSTIPAFQICFAPCHGCRGPRSRRRTCRSLR